MLLKTYINIKKESERNIQYTELIKRLESMEDRGTRAWKDEETNEDNHLPSK